MLHEFQLNLKLKEMDMQVINNKEAYKEDRKDKRTKIQATQQSELIEQRKGNAGISPRLVCNVGRGCVSKTCSKSFSG